MVPTPNEGVNGPKLTRRGTRKIASKADAWANHAELLADWAWARMVNRSDCYGSYLPLDRRSDKETAVTKKSGLTRKILQRHFEGRSPGDIIGLHAIARDQADGPGEVPACWSRWLGVDIDRHEEETDPALTLNGALRLWSQLRDLGFDPLLTDSNGQGGYHLLTFFAEAVPSERVHAFGRWLVHDWQKIGLPQDPETFPKQASIEAGGFGNWLRLPGRHHTTDHYSRVWDGNSWMEGADAIRAILAKRGDPVELIKPEYVLPKPKPKPTRTYKPGDLTRDAQLASEALKFLSPTMPYADWLRIGMALTTLNRDGLILWDDWSKADMERYKEGVCDRKWRSFHRTGVTLGTLFGMAKANGFVFPDRRVIPATTTRQPLRPKLNVVTGDDDGPVDEADAPIVADLSRFGNYHHESFIDEDGRKKNRVIAHPIDHIKADLDAIVGGWPKRVGDQLFALGRDRHPVYLVKVARLFAWIDGQTHVDWTKGARLVTQERFFEHLGMVSERVEAVETMPHTPPIPGAFYMHPALPPPSGRLDELIDRFTPATPQDRELIKALIVTPSWGALPGRRPAFLVTAVDDDSEQGRGVGKSTLVGVIAECLYQGVIDLTSKNEIEDIKTRMLSPGGREVRILRLDNIKTHRFSWGDLEGLITSEAISGHGMYIGEVRRPNTFTTMITLNGASLSKDMAQRVIVVKLRRPIRTEGWEEETRAFAATHRWDILADAATFLSRSPGDLAVRSRWADWEGAVLSKLADPVACQMLVLERQGLIDEGDSDRDAVRDYLVELIVAKYGNADEALTMIPKRDMAVIVSEATRKHYETNLATSFVKGLAIPELKEHRTTRYRGWLWCGVKRTRPEISDVDVFFYKRVQPSDANTGWY